MPDQVRHDDYRAFYETINFESTLVIISTPQVMRVFKYAAFRVQPVESLQVERGGAGAMKGKGLS